MEIGIKDSGNLIVIYLLTSWSLLPFMLGLVCLLRLCIRGSPSVHVQVEFLLPFMLGLESADDKWFGWVWVVNEDGLVQLGFRSMNFVW